METKKEAAVSASVCQLAPGSGESIKPRASCSTRSSFAGRVATTGVIKGFELSSGRQTHSDLEACGVRAARTERER